MFLVQWSKREEPAEHNVVPVIKDWADQSLRVIWDNYRGDPRVMDWVNKLAVVKRKVRGWRDLETYAYEKGWEGSRLIPLVAAAGIQQPGGNKVPGGIQQPGGNELLLVGGGESRNQQPACPVPMKTGATFDSPFGDTGDELKPVDPPDVVVACDGGPVLSEMEESSSDEEVEKVVVEVDEKIRCKIICQGRLHDWQILYSPIYAWKGKLKGRRCYDCNVKFVHGKKLTGEEAKGLYWASLKNPGHHCTTCDVCLCNPCSRQRDLNSPIKRNSPSKASKRN